VKTWSDDLRLVLSELAALFDLLSSSTEPLIRDKASTIVLMRMHELNKKGAPLRRMTNEDFQAWIGLLEKVAARKPQ
jgi:hypothetical protein